MLTKLNKPFVNPPAIWEWIKKEVERDNVDSISLETIIEDIPVDQCPLILKRVSSRIVTIKLGPDITYPGF